MIFFPAIDLINGKCVRLEQGDPNKATIFDDNPLKRARYFKRLGCRWLHIVDLDGALRGKSINHEIVKNILKIKGLNIQLGGGIRTIESVDLWISLGVKRVILGTVAIKNPHLVKEACGKYPGKIILGIDVRNGRVAIEGWKKQSEIKALDLIKKFDGIGLSAVVYTDISKDGLLKGPSVEETANFACSTKIPVIASGGVTSKLDLEALKEKEETGIFGVISGRAIYDGRLDIEESIKILDP
ncbi:MAG: 1-(5-phosphoribosyl)-5-[(5-phosphoribosylamino)methylideneamino] imidazole-4-carboxamide isomerase [Alphaproteobacteria bacterium MarineAlpha9_Bin2]|nr:MAG: 1-(5-phosphoribosyl)-5-[(5-phosphoribosylamino)methylideneamino] imidazole-4-carboxamide isomerase [Alphaproteobacteria bacterium MarineAlpha9_Bin2]